MSSAKVEGTACRACGGDTVGLLEGEPAVSRCLRCGLVALRRVPQAEDGVGYEEDYYEPERGERFLGPLERPLSWFKEMRLRSILSRFPGPGSILDIGCGRGDLIERFQRRGWRAVGTQISRTAAEAARRQRGVDVRVGELPDLGFRPGEFDVITLFHVLEHLPRPAEYLECARGLLREGGLLVVEVPDCGGLGFRILGRRHLCFDYPHHLVFFSRAGLLGLLDRSGFRAESESHFTLEYSPFTWLQNMLNCLPGEPNRLYRALRRNAEGAKLRRSPWTYLHFALGGLLAPAAFALSLTGLFLGRGNTLRVHARSRPVGIPVQA